MKELVKKRSLHSKIFDLGGRKRMLRVGIKKPLHYINEQGQLEDIELTPTLDRGQHFISKASYKARIGRDFPGYRYTGERGTISAELVEISGNPIAKREPEYVDNRFNWRNISLDIDCTLIPRNAGLAAIVTLHSENAPRSFTWEILGDKAMMRPVVGRDAAGRTLELEQEWSGDRLTIAWTGRVTDARLARKGQGSDKPKYPVWIDPTVNEAIVAGSDDAYSYDYDMSLQFAPAGTRLLVGYTAFNMHAGFRFQSIAVPQGATIDSAILTLYAGIGSAGAAVRIYGNDVDDAAVWANPGNLMRNITKTSAFVNFSAFTATGALTIGVTSPVQEIINRAGWLSNNDLGIVAFPTGNGYAAIAAYEHPTFQEAQLDIVYTEAGTTEDADASTFGASIVEAAGNALADADADSSGTALAEAEGASTDFQDGAGLTDGVSVPEASGDAFQDADSDSSGAALIEAAGDAIADAAGLSDGVANPEAVGDFVLTLEADGLADGVSVAEAVGAVTVDAAALSDGLASLDAEGAGGSETPEIRQGPLGGSGVRGEASAWRKPDKTRVRHRQPRQIEIIKVGKWPEDAKQKPERLERIDYGKIIDQRDPEDVAAAEEEEALIAILALAA